MRLRSVLLLLLLTACGTPKAVFRFGAASPLVTRIPARQRPTPVAAPGTAPEVPAPLAAAAPPVTETMARRRPRPPAWQRLARRLLPPKQVVRLATRPLREVTRPLGRHHHQQRPTDAVEAGKGFLLGLLGALLTVAAVFGVLISLIVGSAASVQTWLGVGLVGLVFIAFGALIMWLSATGSSTPGTPSSSPAPASVPAPTNRPRLDRSAPAPTPNQTRSTPAPRR